MSSSSSAAATREGAAERGALRFEPALDGARLPRLTTRFGMVCSASRADDEAGWPEL